MNFIFTNNHLLPLLLLIGLPLILHLFSRARPPRYLFSSIMFIQKIIKKNQRIKRPQNWIMLVLRTLLFAALIMVFLKPLLFRKAGGPAESQRTIVIVIDATASMALVEGAQTRFATACAEASEILSGLSYGDKANIIWMRNPSRAVFKKPGINLSYLKKELMQARGSSETASVREAVRMAVDMSADAPGTPEIYLISDFQISEWQAYLKDLPRQAAFFTIKVGREQTVNRSVADIYTIPKTPLPGEPVTVYATLFNYSDRPQQAKVWLSTDTFRQSRQVLMKPWEKTTAVFNCRFTKAGHYPVKVQLEEDAFPADDSRLGILPVKSQLRIGIWANTKETAAAWLEALKAVEWTAPEYLADSDVKNLQNNDLIMISGWQGEYAENFKNYLEGGGSLVIYPDHLLDMAKWSVLSRMFTVSREGQSVFMWQTLKKPLPLKVEAPEDKAFALFRDGQYGDPVRGVFYGRFLFPDKVKVNGQVLLSYADGIPALIRATPENNVIFWNLPLMPKVSNWASQIEYLPFLAELVLSARPAGKIGTVMINDPGDPLICFFPGEHAAQSITLVSDQGVNLKARAKPLDNRMRLISEPAVSPGLYQWKQGDQVIHYSIVNFPPRESDLRSMAMAEIAQHKIQAVEGGYAVREMHAGIPVWPYLLAFAVGVAVLESILGNFFRNRQSL